MRKALRSAAACFCACAGLLGLQACTSVPSIEVETKAVPISEVVERVKCEIWLATKDRLGDPDYAFLDKWDATVDLTLSINEQSGISPGVSVIDPLKSVTLPGKGTFNQSFTLGLGGGGAGQSNLSDTVSFSLSLDELARKDRGLNRYEQRLNYYRLCQPLQDGDLIGHLRFKEWVDQALKPVRDPDNGFHYLTKGVHPVVTKGGGPAKISFVSAQAGKKLDAEKPDATVQGGAQTDANRPSSEAIDNIKQQISPDELTHHPEKLDNLIADHQRDTNKNILDILTTLRRNVVATKKKPTLMLNDPIDTISHQIQFIVTWNGNVTPTWSLVNAKGPGPASGSFVSGQRQATHQLLITMGAVKQSVDSVRSSQQFSAALRSSPITVIPAQ